MKSIIRNKGFTLMELMICVLIVGVLTTIALPMYRKFVEKTKAAEAITILNTIARAEQSHVLLKHEYTSSIEDLDITFDSTTQIQNGILNTKNFEVVVSEGLPELKNTAYITAFRRTNGGDVLYSIFQCIDKNMTLCLDENTEDNITCDALGITGDVNPMNPCGGYPIDNKDGCKNIGGFWSSATGTCYDNAEDRCLALSGAIEEGICKFIDDNNSISDQILDYDMACYGNGIGSASLATANSYSFTASSCYQSIINDGGVCYGAGSNDPNNSGGGGCGGSTINNGGTCIVTGAYGCPGTIINEGGSCISDASFDTRGCYRAEINSGGVCEAGSQSSCYKSVVNEGGVCRATSRIGNGYGCKEITINGGGICVGIGNHGCRQAVVKDGGIVVAVDSTTGYMNTYQGSGCCVDCTGTGYCHDSGHVCNVTAEEKERYCNM